MFFLATRAPRCTSGERATDSRAQAVHETYPQLWMESGENSTLHPRTGRMPVLTGIPAPSFRKPHPCKLSTLWRRAVDEASGLRRLGAAQCPQNPGFAAQRGRDSRPGPKLSTTSGLSYPQLWRKTVCIHIRCHISTRWHASLSRHGGKVADPEPGSAATPVVNHTRVSCPHCAQPLWASGARTPSSLPDRAKPAVGNCPARVQGKTLPPNTPGPRARPRGKMAGLGAQGSRSRDVAGQHN